LQLFPSVTSFLSFLLFVIPFATSSLSFQLFPSVPYNIYVVPSVLTLPFPSLLPPHRFNASILFIHLFLSFQAVSFRYFLRLFQVLHPVRLPLPFFQSVHFFTSFLFQLLHPVRSVRLRLPFVLSRSFRYFLPLVSSLASGFIVPVLSLQLFPSIRYFFPFVNSFKSGSLLPSLSFQLLSLLFPIPRSFRFKLFSSLRYFLPIVSTLPSCSFTSSFHVKAFIILCFHSFCFNASIPSSFRFKSFISLPLFFRFNSSFLFVLLFLRLRNSSSGESRLRGAIRLRGIRLWNSSSSADGKVIPAQRPQ